MRDDLLAQADRAIRASQVAREQAHKDRVNARMAIARVRATLRLASIEREQSVSLYRDTAGKAVLHLQQVREL
jgi:hypothetical protein